MEKQAKTIYIEDEENITYPKPDLDIPPAGKVWKRKSDGALFNGMVFLGQILFKDGKTLKKPIIETVDDYELVDM